jgi:hypothetical protein
MRWTIDFGGYPQDVTVATSGKATREGFAGMNAELVDDERFGPGMLVLLDHTHLVVDELSSQDVQSISDDFVRHDDELPSAVAALVAPTPVQFGLAHMSTMLAEPTTPSIRVFYTQTEALEWLRDVRERVE